MKKLLFMATSLILPSIGFATSFTQMEGSCLKKDKIELNRKIVDIGNCKAVLSSKGCSNQKVRALASFYTILETEYYVVVTNTCINDVIYKEKISERKFQESEMFEGLPGLCSGRISYMRNYVPVALDKCNSQRELFMNSTNSN